MNERLKKMGYYSAREFNQSVLKWLESENARNLYFEKQRELLERERRNGIPDESRTAPSDELD
jgi:HPr kinase/phosphorylase